MINAIKNFVGSFYLDAGAECVLEKIAEVVLFEVYPKEIVVIHIQLFNLYFAIIKKRCTI